MEPRISIITLAVNDIQRSRSFYTQMGFTTDAKADEDMVFLKTNGTILALYPQSKMAEELPGEPIQRGGSPGFTLAHNVPEKDSVDHILVSAKTAGGRIVKPAAATFWGGYSGYFTDPDGFYWEVAWAPFFEYDERGNLKV